jgi:hypothetical protein
MWKSARVSPPPKLSPAIVRLRRIAAAPGDHRLLDDGPPHPDARLLDLCAEIAHQRKVADAAWQRFAADGKALWCSGARADELHSASGKEIQRLDSLLREAGKLRAKTGAGIYAKALAVAHAKSGALPLCKSLAEDLITNPALRAALWGAEPEPPPERPDRMAMTRPRRTGPGPL